MWRLRPALPIGDVRVIDIANLADAGLAVEADNAHLAGGHTDLVAMPFSFAMSCAAAPAERTSCAPLPG